MKTSRLKNTPRLVAALLTLLSGMTTALLAPAPALAVLGPEIELRIGETGTNLKLEDGPDGNGARFELSIVSTSTLARADHVHSQYCGSDGDRG